MSTQLHAAHHAAGLGPELLAGERHELRLAGRPGDAVDPLFVVELPHQLDDEVTFLRKGPVGALQHVAAQLASGFLQGRNGRSRCQAARGAALAHIPVAADLLQLGHPRVPVADAVALQPRRLQRGQAAVPQRPGHVHDVPRPVRQLLFVHARRVAQQKAGLCRQLDVLVHGMVHLVDGGLGVLHHVDVPKPRRAVLFHEQRVEHERIQPVVVESPVGILRVVFAGVEHHPIAELAVVQQRFPFGPGLLVVPVHHHALVGGVDVLVVHVLCHFQCAAGVAVQLGPPGFQLVVVFQSQAEQVRRFLHVHHARLPVQHQDVHALDGDVSQAAALCRVPEHALHAGALLELAPPGVAVGLLVVGLFQHHRQHLRKDLRRLLIVRRSGQYVRFRVVVHRVGVFIRDGVEQPPARRGRLTLHHLVLVILPVPHPEPQLVVHDPGVQRRLAALVPLQQLRCLRHLFGADDFFQIVFQLDLLSCLFPPGHTL